jgi:hypothetical protein
MYFTFEHESSIVPITLTIRVEYAPYYRESDYENPSEFDFTYTHEIYCGDLNLTECIGNSNYTKLQDELETAMRESITEHFFNS